MKICPTCSTQWPDRANFCPKDGTDLSVIAPVEEAEEEVAEAREEVVNEEAADDEPDPEEEAQLDQQARRGFSETQWFMRAQDPDRLKDEPSTEDLWELQGEYERDEKIPEEVRSRFSLRRKGKKTDE